LLNCRLRWQFNQRRFCKYNFDF